MSNDSQAALPLMLHFGKIYELELFKGILIVTHIDRNLNKTFISLVCLTGIGNSSGDISVELSRHAKQVYLSTRRGSWVFPRMRSGGYPSDLYKYRRILSFVPSRIMASAAERIANQRFDHQKFGLQPDHGVFEQHPMVNDDFPIRIMTGKLKIKSNVKFIKETSNPLVLCYLLSLI